MKPLNRPMFKYGGPIKEGIMSGMKDNTGTGLVGDKRYPKTDGRSHHVAVLPFLGMNALRTGAMRMAPRAIQSIKNLFGRNVPQGVGTTTIGGKTVQTVGSGKNIFQPNLAGRIIMQDPTVRTAGAIIKGVTSPAVKGPVASAARLVFSPTGVATGLYYANGKFFNKDTNEEVPPPNEEVVLGGRVGTSGAPGGGDPDMFLTPRTKEDPKKTKSEENEALKQKYYNIMGLDKMKKDAVYDSLIDASRIVSEEGGDLKGSLKSGTLQNKIIQAISGQLDKSAALKKQIDAAILKGEITKDIKANDPAEKNKARLVEKQIELADQKLSGGTLIENIRAGAKDLGNTTSNVYNAIITTYKTEPEVLADTTEAAEFRKKDNYTTDADLVQKIVAADPKKGAGIYIVDKTAVYIDENGNASTLYQG